jgi:hypothetical protein
MVETTLQKAEIWVEEAGLNMPFNCDVCLGGMLVGGIAALVTMLVGFAILSSVVSPVMSLSYVANSTGVGMSPGMGTAFQMVIQNLPIFMGISVLVLAGAWTFMGTGSMSSSQVLAQKEAIADDSEEVRRNERHGYGKA